MTDANSLIMGAGPSAKFLEVGAKHVGVITALDTQHARKFGTQDPDFWPDGRAKMQAVITLKTEERDPEISGDNGVRRLFVSSKGMREAIAHAVKKSGASGLAVGGTLKIKYTRNGEGKNAANPPKVYAAEYEPPPAGHGDDLDDPGEYDDYSDEPF